MAVENLDNFSAHFLHIWVIDAALQYLTSH